MTPTNLHWQENGELHPDDLECLRDRWLADAALDSRQHHHLAGWVQHKTKAPLRRS
ncbi:MULTISPECIES: hypothetical protein [Synechococcales]|uniref:hypothetical protein n=1 Tax=unclassified Synechococcus TaxID=2626047 RepID=UPI0020CFDD4C|nr:MULTISPECIES: hypothetical protein [unclassified Synechococcus]MCP9845608.1 hypothetical protein [Synechococcus sp. Lug-A]